MEEGSDEDPDEDAAQSTLVLFVISILEEPRGLDQHQHNQTVSWGAQTVTGTGVAAGGLKVDSEAGLKVDTRPSQQAVLIPPVPCPFPTSQAASQTLWSRGSLSLPA